MASILMSSSIHQERAASQQYEFAMTVQPAKFDTKANLRARHAAKVGNRALYLSVANRTAESGKGS